jgi:hypothetical protein
MKMDDASSPILLTENGYEMKISQNFMKISKTYFSQIISQAASSHQWIFSHENNYDGLRKIS